VSGHPTWEGWTRGPKGAPPVVENVGPIGAFLGNIDGLHQIADRLLGGGDALEVAHPCTLQFRLQ
jgi:hypothetical protein